MKFIIDTPTDLDSGLMASTYDVSFEGIGDDHTGEVIRKFLADIYDVPMRYVYRYEEWVVMTENMADAFRQGD